jgi:hypothetical protein
MGWRKVMNYALHPTDFPTYHGEARTRPDAPAPGLLRRLYQSFGAWRQREADREIAAFIARSGGRFTDSVERELFDRLATGDWQRQPPARRGF